MKYSTAMVGVILALQAIFMGLSAPVAGWYLNRYGAFAPIVTGTLLCSLSTVFIVWGEHITTFSIAMFLSVFGVGVGLFQATNNAEIMTAAPDDKVSLIGSILALIRYLGMIAGTGLAIIFAGEMHAAMSLDIGMLVDNIRILFLICGVLCLFVFIIGFWRPNSKL